MKYKKVHVALVVFALVVVAAVLSFAARSSRGQSATPKAGSLVKPAILKVNRTNVSSAEASSPFAAAATRNAVLRDELRWAFGGKEQRGWYLYDSLINETLKLQSDAEAGDFGGALATWQKKIGLTGDDVLDQDSLMALVSNWQSRRLKNHSDANPDELVTAPSSDFYDPSRPAELRQAEGGTYAAYKQMVAAAIADPTLNLAHTSDGELAPTEKYFKIVSGFRSREYQNQLRRQSPNAGSAGLAVHSPHTTGRALDLYVGGDPVNTKDSNRAIQVSTPAYRWLVRNAERFGFHPYFYEPWHWEYVR